jgi:hypothetical protein
MPTQTKSSVSASKPPQGAKLTSGSPSLPSIVTIRPASVTTTRSSFVMTTKDDGSTGVSEGEKETRLRLYKRDDVRRFVEWLLREKATIVPTYDPSTGDTLYSNIPGGSQYLLTELNSAGILQKYVLDQLPSCPQCDASNFSVAYACPYCQAHDIERGMAIEHYACGHVDLELNFRRGNQLVCPKCNKPLKLIGTDYRRIGTDYLCNSCSKFFDSPIVELGCRKCGKSSKPEEVPLKPVYAYKINERLRGELVAHCTMESQFTDFLTKYGFEVNAPIVVQGLSGIEHTFDMHAWREEMDIMIDFVSANTDIGPEEVAAFFAKIFDTKPRRAILIAMPKLSESGQKLSAMYGVEIIAADNVAKLIENLTLVLNMPGQLGTQTHTIGLKTPVTTHDADLTHEISREITARLANKLDSGSGEPLGTPTQRTQRVRTDSVSAVSDLRKARADMARLLDREIP